MVSISFAASPLNGTLSLAAVQWTYLRVPQSRMPAQAVGHGRGTRPAIVFARRAPLRQVSYLDLPYGWCQVGGMGQLAGPPTVRKWLSLRAMGTVAAGLVPRPALRATGGAGFSRGTLFPNVRRRR